jgi:hypothetical protein
MFEISIFSVIVLAIGYWVALWLMGRHDDVLHGDFVHVEAPPEAVPTTSPASQTDSMETLQSLLTSIKRELKDAAQI